MTRPLRTRQAPGSWAKAASTGKRKRRHESCVESLPCLSHTAGPGTQTRPGRARNHPQRAESLPGASLSPLVGKWHQAGFLFLSVWTMVTWFRITGVEGELFVRNAGWGAPHSSVPAALGAALAPLASLHPRLLSLQHVGGAGPCSHRAPQSLSSRGTGECPWFASVSWGGDPAHLLLAAAGSVNLQRDAVWELPLHTLPLPRPTGNF